MGGWTDNPTYDLVCVGNTGHAEVVQIRFDRKITSYDGLLNCFWSIHDPTTWGRQVPDTGSQYRSVIFYHSDEQQDLALASKEKAQTGHGETIATEIASAGAYYLAETYHQQYEEKRMRRHRSD
jgi:peptide-methionine (S)-S-oxide reductase